MSSSLSCGPPTVIFTEQNLQIRLSFVCTICWLTRGGAVNFVSLFIVRWVLLLRLRIVQKSNSATEARRSCSMHLNALTLGLACLKVSFVHV